MPHHQNEKKLVGLNSGSKSILLGEDDIDDEEFLKEIFSSVDNSFSLIFIQNGKKVIDYLDGLPDGHSPCLIILDYNMPALNGAEILWEIKNRPKYADIPKIIWSTSPSDMYRKKCMEAGADDYVMKPSSVNELMEIVRYIITFC